jgi:NAD(P)-dependent dehydrogenase (short-subunit alcohol dehydrogenase family)
MEELDQQAFAGRVAVITGAGSGLGRELALAAAGHGMRLVLADGDADLLERLTDELDPLGAEWLAMVCDVARAAHVDELADAAIARFHGVHLVFNLDFGAAGRAPQGYVWEHRAADWDRLLGASLWGPIHAARAFVPLMLESATRDAGYRGHVVNGVAVPGVAADVAARAVAGVTQALRRDLRAARAPVGVSLLCAGPALSAVDVFDAVHAERPGIGTAALPGLDAAPPPFDAWLRGASEDK